VQRNPGPPINEAVPPPGVAWAQPGYEPL